MTLPHIIGFEGSWPKDVEMTWGSAAILKGDRVYNSILVNDRYGIGTEEVAKAAITPFFDPFPISEMVPMWVVAMDRNSESERIYGPTACESLDMCILPKELTVRKDGTWTQSVCMFFTEGQFTYWRVRAVELGLEHAKTPNSLLQALVLAPRNPQVHARRYLLAEEHLKSRVKATAKGLLASYPETFAEYLALIGHTE